MIFTNIIDDTLSITKLDQNSPIITITGELKIIWLYLQENKFTPYKKSTTADVLGLDDFLSKLIEHNIYPSQTPVEIAKAEIEAKFGKGPFAGHIKIINPEPLEIYAAGSGVESPYTGCYPDEPPLLGVCK